MSTPNFRFKQFTVWHDKCAMKVGTDGVLLGAWAPIAVSHQPSEFSILDIGTGSGLIALMLAQRCPNAQIDAIDIDEAAVVQARQNVQISNFKFQISNFVSRLQDWKPETKYDLIVSNPPYFQNSLKNPDKGRELARHTDSLPFAELIQHSVRLLKAGGQFALILPADAETEIRHMAEQAGMVLTRVTRVYSKETKPARRVLMSFVIPRSRVHVVTIIEDTLVLEDEKGGRSAAYSELTKDFYL